MVRQVEREAVTTHLRIMLRLNMGQAIPPTPVSPHGMYRTALL